MRKIRLGEINEGLKLHQSKETFGDVGLCLFEGKKEKENRLVTWNV